MPRKKQYKVVYACDRCNRASETRYKDNPTAPDRCVKCGSSYTRKIRVKKQRTVKN